MTTIPVKYYYVGEKPPGTPCSYVDENGDLISSLGGATEVAKTSINSAADVNVSCTDGGDGSFTIDWPKGASASAFTAVGTMRIRIWVTQGDYAYFLKPELIVEIRE